MASLRHRRGIAEAEEYDDGSGTAPDDDTDTATEEEEEEEEEEDHRLHLGLHSMTAKGIQHLCSELLEIKKASEQDFRANVYLSYLSFIRMFQNAGDLDKDVHRLKRQVIAHRRLIQHLDSNCLTMSSSSSSILLAPGGSTEDEAGMDDDTGYHDEELELDVLLSEHRMEQALELLELQGQALQQQQVADEAAMIALSARKARVADRLASVAGNPRTPRPELVKALSGLCKLGDAERANHLLFNSHSASVEELRASHSQSSNYIKDLARMVLSSIVHASRSFVALHGHPSPYTPQLLRWAREEMEDFSIAFSEYVRSMSQAGQSLALALEAAECAVSYSPLLRPLGIASEQDVVGLMAPCIREVLAMYGRHLKEVVRLLVASDAWVLGRFLMPLQMPPPAAVQAEHHYCLLTSSGRKFVTLIQEVVDDVACSLLNLGILDDDSSVAVQLVAELFREYMHSIVELIPRKEAERITDGDEQYMWHLSVLINCTTLVSLFPTWSPPSGFSAPGAQREAISAIKEAAGQVWDCFCQQFIRDTMMALSGMSAQQGSSCLQGEGGTMMPSLAFQVVFLRVRRLKDAYGAILSGEDGTMKKLLQELMEAIISWLSSNLDSWIVHGARQAQLDVHFLLEFARLGGFDITPSALDLLRKAQAEQVEDGEEDVCDWAAGAAKHAVQVLLAAPVDAAQVVDAAEEFEFDDVMDELEVGGYEDSAASSSASQAPPEDAKSSDEFISIEVEDDDEEKLVKESLNKQQQQQNLMLKDVRQGDDDSSGDGESRRRQATTAENKGSSTKKKAAVSRSSRPRWQ